MRHFGAFEFTVFTGPYIIEANSLFLMEIEVLGLFLRGNDGFEGVSNGN